MSHGQIDAQARASPELSPWFYITAHLFNHITAQTDMQREKESNLSAQLWGLKFTEMLYTAVWLGLVWGDVREMTLH